MKGLLSNFDASLLVAAVITVGALGVAAYVAIRLRGSDRIWLPSVTRILTVGAVMVTIVSTALPRSARFESGGDVVLMPGRGGLGDLGQIFDDPTSLAAVLLLSNIVLYMPVAFFAYLGWYERRIFVLPACLALSILVETMQALLLGRVAATDDVILNMAGAVLGYAAAATMVRYTSRPALLLGIANETT